MTVPNAARAAMPIQVYERMSDSDQGEYLRIMIVGAEELLADRPDLVAQIKKLFTTRMARDDNIMGMVELEMNIAAVNRADADNLVKDPNARSLAVELAMIATLKANGIAAGFDGGEVCAATTLVGTEHASTETKKDAGRDWRLITSTAALDGSWRSP